VRSIRWLKKEGLACAKWCGHDMGRFKTTYVDVMTGKPKVAISECKRCGAYVQVNTKPRPNEISIGGDAFAANCRGKR